MLQKTDYFKIGTIRKTHGVKGEMLLLGENDIDFDYLGHWLFFNIEECLIPFKIETIRSTTDKTALFCCESITSVEQANTYINTEIFLPLNLKDDISDYSSPSNLNGLEVVNKDTNEILGTVSAFIESTLNPLLEIKTTNDSFLLPFNEAFILGVEKHQLFVRIPDGLLDL